MNRIMIKSCEPTYVTWNADKVTHALLDHLEMREKQFKELMFPRCLEHFNHKKVTRVELTTVCSILLKPLSVLVFDFTVEETGHDL